MWWHTEWLTRTSLEYARANDDNKTTNDRNSALIHYKENKAQKIITCYAFCLYAYHNKKRDRNTSLLQRNIWFYSEIVVYIFLSCIWFTIFLLNIYCKYRETFFLALIFVACFGPDKTRYWALFEMNELHFSVSYLQIQAV